MSWPNHAHTAADREHAGREGVALTEEWIAAVLATHEDCVANEGALGANDTGLDVWSCGIRLPFNESLDEARRLHLAAALTAPAEDGAS